MIYTRRHFYQILLAVGGSCFALDGWLAGWLAGWLVVVLLLLLLLLLLAVLATVAAAAAAAAAFFLRVLASDVECQLVSSWR